MRDSPLVKIVAVLAWAIVSIAVLWRLPIWIGLLYVVGIIVGYRAFRRRDARVRREWMADADDLRRADIVDDRPERPSGLGYGRHSWARPDPNGAAERDEHP